MGQTYDHEYIPYLLPLRLLARKSFDAGLYPGQVRLGVHPDLCNRQIGHNMFSLKRTLFFNISLLAICSCEEVVIITGGTGANGKILSSTEVQIDNGLQIYLDDLVPLIPVDGI